MSLTHVLLQRQIRSPGFTTKPRKVFRQYSTDVKSLVQVFEELGNPFDEKGTELTVLDIKVVADEEGVFRMRQIEKNRNEAV